MRIISFFRIFAGLAALARPLSRNMGVSNCKTEYVGGSVWDGAGLMIPEAVGG